MWERPDGSLDTHPAPPHNTHTNTHLHSDTHFRYAHSCPRRLLHTLARTPYATHLRVDSAPVSPPCPQTAGSAERASGFAGQGALRRHPSSASLTGLAATVVSHPRKPAPSPTPEHTHKEEYSSFPWPRATSRRPARARVTANSDASFEFPSPYTLFPL